MMIWRSMGVSASASACVCACELVHEVLTMKYFFYLMAYLLTS